MEHVQAGTTEPPKEENLRDGIKSWRKDYSDFAEIKTI